MKKSWQFLIEEGRIALNKGKVQKYKKVQKWVLGHTSLHLPRIQDKDKLVTTKI